MSNEKEKNTEYFKANQAHWNKCVLPHAESDFYDVEGFKKGKTSLNSIELAALGDVKGQSMLHLQCHFGQDSLAWTRMGAKVTGVDFSSTAIELARELNTELALDAEFICTNVYDLKKHLEGQFDIVFTSYGVLGWLPDMDRWAELVAHYLKPGGIFYIVEFHPTYYMIDFDNLQLTYPYFNIEVFKEEVEGSYADRDADITGVEYFWQHSLSEIITALLKNGLQLEQFDEFAYSPYNCFPNMVETSKGKYEVKDHEGNIPLMFEIKMKKPL